MRGWLSHEWRGADRPIGHISLPTQGILRAKGENVQVLNASAVGWTLTNEYNFLQNKGIFESRVTVLEVGTRALYPGSEISYTVGADPNLPDHNPPLAIVEVIDRYLLPRVLRRLGMSSAEAQPVWSDRSIILENYQRGLGALKGMVALVSRFGAKPIILLAPDKDEAIWTRQAQYQKDLSDLASSAGGKLVDLMPALHTRFAKVEILSATSLTRTQKAIES